MLVAKNLVKFCSGLTADWTEVPTATDSTCSWMINIFLEAVVPHINNRSLLLSVPPAMLHLSLETPRSSTCPQFVQRQATDWLNSISAPTLVFSSSYWTPGLGPAVGSSRLPSSVAAIPGQGTAS